MLFDGWMEYRGSLRCLGFFNFDNIYINLGLNVIVLKEIKVLIRFLLLNLVFLKDFYF